MRIAVLALAGLLTVSGVGAGATADRTVFDQDQSVSIDVKVKHQLMQGFGSSARVWTDPHLSRFPETVVPPAARVAILRDLYGRLGLTRLRPILDQGVQKQRGGPFSFEGKLADAHIELVKQAKPYGLKTVFPGPVYLEPWMRAGDVEAYADWAMAMIRRWRAGGVELPLYSPQNEPQINGNFPPDFLRRVVIELGKRLRRAGFATKLVVPDDENPADAYRRSAAILSDAEARRYVGAIAYHDYGTRDTADIVRLGKLGAKYKLPVWMTEYSNARYLAWPDALEWAARMHTFIVSGRVSAIDYFAGFFGSWAEWSTMISLRFENGVYRDRAFTPIYWLTGHWSRFVRPGYRRVATTAAVDGVLTTAFTGKSKLVVVSVNPSTETKTVRYSIEGGAGVTFARFRTSTDERWRPLEPIRVRDSFTTQLPPRSVTTFVGKTSGS